MTNSDFCLEVFTINYPVSFFIYTPHLSFMNWWIAKEKTKNCPNSSQVHINTKSDLYFLFFCLLLSSVVLDLQGDSCFYWFQLQAHTFWRQKLRSYARRAQRASWADAKMRWPIHAISHEKIFHRYQHCIRLLLRHHWPTWLNLRSENNPFSFIVV